MFWCVRDCGYIGFVFFGVVGIDVGLLCFVDWIGLCFFDVDCLV